MATDVSNETDLQGMIADVTEDYNLTGNVTMTADWEPYMMTGYSGTFEGNGYTISDLTITYNSNYVGFMGSTTNGTVQNLNLSNIAYDNTDTTLRSYVGGVVGYMRGDVDYCTAEGTIEGKHRQSGGIVGYLIASDVDYSDSDVTITEATLYLGGVVGYSYGVGSKVRNCTSTGAVTCSGGGTGGILGQSGRMTIVSDCYSDMDVTGTTNVGGVVGGGELDVDDCYHESGTVSGTSYVGGVVGQVASGENFDNCYAKGSTVTTSSGHCGGFVGKTGRSNFTDCYVENVSVDSTGTSGGGFCGSTTTSTPVFTRCFVDETSTVTGTTDLGGFVGSFDGGTATVCGSAATVTGTGYCGGFVGDWNGTLIEKSYATGDVLSTDSSGNYIFAGGFVGESTSPIDNCYSEGDVGSSSYKWGSTAGGFAGTLAVNSTTKRCYSTGDVYQQSSRTEAGGFVGEIRQTVNPVSVDDCYSVGEIQAQGASVQGLFCGNISGSPTVSNCGCYENSSGLYAIASTSGSVTYEKTSPIEWYNKGENVYDTGSYNWDFSTPVWYEWSNTYPLFYEQESTGNAVFFGCHF